MVELGHLLKYCPLQWLWFIPVGLVPYAREGSSGLERKDLGATGMGERDADLSIQQALVTLMCDTLPWCLPSGLSALHPSENKAPDFSAGSGDKEMRVF